MTVFSHEFRRDLGDLERLRAQEIGGKSTKFVWRNCSKCDEMGAEGIGSLRNWIRRPGHGSLSRAMQGTTSSDKKH